MQLSEEVMTLLADNEFYFHSANVYNGKQRYVRYIRNIPARTRIYTNCGVVVETWAENFLIVRVWGMHPRRLELYQDITRDLFPGVNQFLEQYQFATIIDQLQKKPVAWRTQLSS